MQPGVSAKVVGLHAMAQPHKPTVAAEADYVVTRAIYLHGQPVKVGAVVTLPRVLGAELMAANKLARAPEKPAKPAKPATPNQESAA